MLEIALVLAQHIVQAIQLSRIIVLKVVGNGPLSRIGVMVGGQVGNRGRSAS